MANASLTLGDSRKRKISSWSLTNEMQPTRRSLGFSASRKLSICIEMRLTLLKPGTNPPDEAMPLRELYVSNQALELAIAIHCPFSDILSKVTYGPQQIKTRQSSSPQIFIRMRLAIDANLPSLEPESSAIWVGPGFPAGPQGITGTEAAGDDSPGDAVLARFFRDGISASRL